MELKPLPAGIASLLEALGAPPRLIAHLTLVHDVAHTLVAHFEDAWPSLAYDQHAVLIGAATHDIGKIAHPDELARFARTHGQWAVEPEPRIEDLLVALADHWWRGKRDEALETALCQQIAEETHQAAWQVFLVLDEIAAGITAEADSRLAWQSQHIA